MRNVSIFQGGKKMSFQGKQLPPEMVEMVVRLKNHYDQERKKSEFVSTKNPAQRTADSLGIGIATVKRIMSRYKKDDEKVVYTIKQRPGRPLSSICPIAQPIVRTFIRGENLLGRRVSIERVRRYLSSELDTDIPKTTLWRALNRWGFVHGEGRRRNSLREQDRIILARREYLRAKLSNRRRDGTLKRPEVYLDETFINKNHSCRFTWFLEEDGPLVNKPSGVGPRLIVVHAVTEKGWVDGARLVFEAKKRTGDYHGQMNWENFSNWFENQLLPNIESGSIVVLDNAGYHNVLATDTVPNNSFTKEQLRQWLTRNKYPWREDMLKSELLELCRRFAPAPEYKLDRIAEKRDVAILRTPPYHPELQPIETCWAVVKNHMADNCDYTMAGLRKRLPEAFGKITPNTCKGIIKKVFEQELKYWNEDEKLDELYSKDAAEEQTGSQDGEGDEFFLEAV